MEGFEGSFNEAAIDNIIASFADDAVVRFADLPEMRGIEEIGKFLRARFARLKDYRIKKNFKSVADNIMEEMRTPNGLMRRQPRTCKDVVRSLSGSLVEK